MKKFSQELRFLVTQNCTYDCFFCHGEGLEVKKPDLLNSDDISFIFNVGRTHLGYKHATISGGEPLMRSDIMDIVSKIYINQGKTTLTTNGSLLEEKIYIGNYIDRLNLLMHSTNEATYKLLTGRSNVFHKVIYGVNLFRSKFPNVEVRLNSTLIGGVNDSENEINGLIQLAARLGASIKFIELYPETDDRFIPIDFVEQIITRQGFVPKVSTTRKNNYSNGFVEVGLTKIFCASVKYEDNPAVFCSNNNDLFISPDGTIKPCRNSNTEISIFGEVKSRNEESLCRKLQEAYAVFTKGGCIWPQKSAKV